MDLLKLIVKHITFGMYLKRDGLKIAPHRSEIERSQYLDPESLENLQFAKLKKLLCFCMEHNEFYKERFRRAGFDPKVFIDFAELKTLPILTKDDIREAGQALFSHGYSKDNTIHKRTGGSTGVPIHVYWNKEAASFKRAGTLRHHGWKGFTPGVRVAAIWGDTDRPKSLKEKIRNLLYERTFYLDTLKFDQDHIDKFIKMIKKKRPEILMGHAHSIFRFAKYVSDRNEFDLKFDAIVTTAMVLTDSERRTIEKVFNSPVFNHYGCEEIGTIASECTAHEGLHVFGEGLYLEIESDNEVMPRRILITDLVNYAMPLIRYDIGDAAIFMSGKCLCGKTLPRLKEVSGRTADFLYTPDRKPVFGISILDTFVIHIPGFKQVQIVQDAYDHLNFRIVKDNRFSEESLDHLKRNVIEIFGDRMRYDLEYIPQIELTPRGKFRFSICRIDDDSIDNLR